MIRERGCVAISVREAVRERMKSRKESFRGSERNSERTILGERETKRSEDSGNSEKRGRGCDKNSE